MNDGVIKFKVHHESTSNPVTEDVSRLCKWRETAREFGGIGVGRDGTGYGNLSERIDRGFLISGSQTGRLSALGPGDFALVFGFDLDHNEIWSRGPVIASSESLTHAALYDALPKAMAIIHVHAERIWRTMIHSAPTTASHIPYGTPEMARAVQHVVEGESGKNGLIVMGGHRNGILFYGSSLAVAGTLMVDMYGRCCR
jgi:hypothetical protein